MNPLGDGRTLAECEAAIRVSDRAFVEAVKREDIARGKRAAEAYAREARVAARRAFREDADGR